MFYSGFAGSAVRAERIKLPTDTAGLLGWWHSGSARWQDASGTVVAGATDPCRRWDDASGAGNHLLAPSDDARPVVASGVQAGVERVMLLFDGVDDGLRNDAVGAALAGSDQPCTLMCVVQRPGTGTQTMLGLASAASNNPFHDVRFGANRMELLRRDDAATLVTVQGAIPLDTQLHVVTAVFSGVNVWLYQDLEVKAEEEECDVGACTFTRFGIGHLPRLTPTQFLAGHLGEVAVWDRMLTDAERLVQVHGLAGRWSRVL